MKRVVIVLVGVVLVLGGCGNGGTGGDTGGPGERSLDRCSLMTAGEAEQWLGAGVSTPSPAEDIDGEPDPVTCLYENSAERNTLLIQVYDGAVYFAEVGSPARTGETLEGLGEDAWSGDGAVRFLQNDWSVSVARITGRIPDEALVEIAQVLSSRLP